MTDPLLTAKDVQFLREEASYCEPDSALGDDFVNLADRIQQWLDQQMSDDAFDATIQRSIDDGSFDRAFGPVLNDITEEG